MAGQTGGEQLKVYISADLEGISGVVGRDQTGESPEFEAARALMAGEVNAAVDGAFAAGATEVVVNDSHGDMRNLAPAAVDQRALLVTGSPKPLSMVEGIDATFQAAMFVGYHARVGTPGVMSHTYMGAAVYELLVNGEPVGETAINAAVAGTFGVPVVMVSGDSRLAEEARQFLGPIEAVAVKEPIGNQAARCLSPEQARARIREAAERAVRRRGEFKPFAFKAPVTIEVAFLRALMAEAASLIPGTRRTGERTLAYTASEFIDVFRCFRAMLVLAGSTLPRK